MRASGSREGEEVKALEGGTASGTLGEAEGACILGAMIQGGRGYGEGGATGRNVHSVESSPRRQQQQQMTGWRLNGASRGLTMPPPVMRFYGDGNGEEVVPGELEEEPGRQSTAAPFYFICPISLELMKDPVTLCTGQTYDRENIVRWLDSGHRTCPATGQALQTVELIPNHMLRSLVQEWSTINQRVGEEPVISPSPTVKTKEVGELLLKIKEGPGKHEAVRRLHGLARQSTKNKVRIAELGAIPVMASLLYSQAEAEMDVVRAAKLAGVARASTESGEQASPERPGEDLLATRRGSNATEVASTSSPASSSPFRSVPPSPEREVLEIVERSVLKASPRPSPFRRRQGDDNAEPSYTCFPALGRRRHTARAPSSHGPWMSSSSNSNSNSSPMARDVGVTEAAVKTTSPTQTASASSPGQDQGSREAAAPRRLYHGDPFSRGEITPDVAMSESDKDGLLACEEGLALLNLLPLGDDDRQLITAITNRGIAISWFLRSEARITIKLNALRLVRNLVNLREMAGVIGSRHATFVRLLRFVRHDLHPEGLKLVLEILLLIFGAGAAQMKRGVDAGAVESLLSFLDAQVEGRLDRSPIIDNRTPAPKPDPCRPRTALDSPTSSGHSLQYIDRNVQAAIAHNMKEDAERGGAPAPLCAQGNCRLNKELALRVVEKLVGKDPDRLALVVRFKGGISTLVRQMGKISPQATEICASTLRSLCGPESSDTPTAYDVEVARRVAMEAGVIDQLLFVVQSGCTSKTRQSAAQLLRILNWKHHSGSPS